MAGFYTFFDNHMHKKDPRQYGLTQADRDFEIERKFGPASAARVNFLLSAVNDPKENVLGAIIFLANTSDEVEDLVLLANEDRYALLNAAMVKEEHGRPLAL